MPKKLTKPIVVPPRGWGCHNRGNYKHGKFVGLTEFVRQLKVGDVKKMPRLWESTAFARATRLGMKIKVRRLDNADTTTVYRTE